MSLIARLPAGRILVILPRTHMWPPVMWPNLELSPRHAHFSISTPTSYPGSLFDPRILTGTSMRGQSKDPGYEVGWTQGCFRRSSSVPKEGRSSELNVDNWNDNWEAKSEAKSPRPLRGFQVDFSLTRNVSYAVR